MIRLLLRIFLSLLLFFLRRRLWPRRGRGPGDGLRAGARPPKPVPPIDRSDVVDVPFTEVPPPNDAARGAAGRP